jgi:HEAT repeat protein
LKLLRNGGPEERLQAAIALNALGPKTKPALPQLIAALDGPGAMTRSHLGEAIAKIGADAVPPLRKALKSDSNLLRSEAISALRRMGTPAASAVPQIRELLRDPDRYVRHASVYALAELDPNSEETAAGLQAALSDPDDFVRVAAASAYWRGCGRSGGVPVLVEIIRNRRSSQRYGAIRALGEMGEGARDAVPALLEWLTNPEQDEAPVSQNCAQSLAKIGSAARSAVPTLSRIARDPKAPARHDAIMVLGAVGGDDAVKTLIAVAKDPDWTIREGVVGALGRIGEPAKSAAPVIVESLKDENPEVRYWTVAALPRLKLDTLTTVKLLEPLLNDDSARVRVETAREIWELTQRPKLIHTLIAGLDVDDWLTRTQAAVALGRVGKAAKGAVPRLVRMLDDKDISVRRAAREALEQIDPETASKHGIDRGEGQPR